MEVGAERQELILMMFQGHVYQDWCLIVRV